MSQNDLNALPDDISQLKKLVLSSRMDVENQQGMLTDKQNEIQRLLVFSHGKKIIKETLSPQLQASYHAKHQNLSQLGPAMDTDSFSQGLTLKERVELLEQALIQEALDKYQWNKSKAATELGLSRVGLSNKLTRYGISDDCQSQERNNDY